MMINFAQINNKKYLKHLRNNLFEIILKPSKVLYFIKKCNVEMSYEMARRLCNVLSGLSRLHFPEFSSLWIFCYHGLQWHFT